MFITMLNSMIMLSIIIALGFYLKKRDILTEEVITKLTYLLLNVSMPFTFFISLNVACTPELLQSAKTILLISLAMHLFFMLIGYIITKILKSPKDEAGIIIFSLTFKNLTYIGLPVVMSLFGDQQPAFYVTLYCIPFNILSFSLGPVLLSSDKNVKVSLNDFKTNINLATLLGIIFFLFSLKLPSAIYSAFDTLAQMTIPVSLLLTGALLTRVDFKTIIKDKKVMLISAINLILLPILFFALLKPFSIDTFLNQFAIIMSLLPSASLTLILTNRYNGNGDFAGKIVLTTTLFSLFTSVLLSSLAFI